MAPRARSGCAGAAGLGRARRWRLEEEEEEKGQCRRVLPGSSGKEASCVLKVNYGGILRVGEEKEAAVSGLPAPEVGAHTCPQPGAQ